MLDFLIFYLIGHALHAKLVTRLARMATDGAGHLETRGVVTLSLTPLSG